MRRQAGAVAVIAAMVLAAGTFAAGERDATHVTVRLNDSLGVPAISWGCENQLVQGSVSFSCDPGVPGSKSQGEPVIVMQFKRVTLVTSHKPSLNVLQTPKGRIYLYSFPTTHP
jgi:hypothetical protein